MANWQKKLIESFYDQVDEIKTSSKTSDDEVILNDALEIGLTIIESSTRDLDQTKHSVFRNFGAPEKVREFYLQDLEQIICGFDRERLENYTLQEIEDLHNLLLDEDRNTKDIEFEAERTDGDPLCP